MMQADFSRKVVALAAFAAAGSALPLHAQNVYLCGGEGRSFAVAGAAAPPGCRRLADPERDLGLSAASPDLEAVVRELAAQSARIDRLERLVIGPRLRPPPSLGAPATDRFDTRGRTRDLGQDIERRLDELSR